MAYYRLIPVIDITTTVKAAKTSPRGYTMYGSMNLEPNEVYDTEGDVVLENSLRSYSVKKAWTQSLETLLKNNDISYKVEQCKVCGGNKRFIIYNPVEVFNEL